MQNNKFKVGNPRQNEILCPFCESYNNKDNVKCLICDGELNYSFPKEETNGVESPNKSARDVQETGQVTATKVNVKLGKEPTCYYCAYPYKIGDTICHVCNANLNDAMNGWQCPTCTFHNKMENNCCDACFAIRESTDSIGHSKHTNKSLSTDNVTDKSKENWTCANCTHYNQYDKYICPYCNKLAPFINKWQCVKCSFLNPDWSHQCEVCNAERNNVGLSSTVSATTDGDMKHCIVCKKSIDATSAAISCDDCSTNTWYCRNRFCAKIIYKNAQYCDKCFLKKGEIIVSYNKVDVHRSGEFVKMCQCDKCGTFTDGNDCSKCQNKFDLSMTDKVLAGINVASAAVKGLFSKLSSLNERK